MGCRRSESLSVCNASSVSYCVSEVHAVLRRVDETCPLLVNAEHVVTEPGCPPIAGVGVTCRQRCTDGYIQAGGSSTRTCTAQLDWTGTQPVCIAGLVTDHWSQRTVPDDRFSGPMLDRVMGLFPSFPFPFPPPIALSFYGVWRSAV